MVAISGAEAVNLLALIDQAVAEGLAAHGNYLSAYGKEGGRAHKMIVRKVAKALRESLSAPREDDQGDAPARQPEPQQSDYWQCEVWSKEWWALFFAQIDRGRSVRFMLDVAMKAEKGATFTAPLNHQPPNDLIDRMQSYPSDGDAGLKWRQWLVRKGVRLPDWRGRMWIFLPKAEPPPDESAA